MAHRPRSVSEMISDLYRRIRRLERRVNAPRANMMVGDWTITENDDGDLIARHENGTTVIIAEV